MSPSATTYDVVEWPSLPIPACHPVRMATVAALAGLSAPVPEQATVVDLGCGSATNLLSIAAAYPGVTAIGVDPSGNAIEKGQELAAAAELTNVQLVHGTEVPLADGQADFVIVHGVLSWVDARTRSAVIAEAARVLRDGGLAMLSYVVDPGALPRLVTHEIGMRVAAAELAAGKPEAAKAAVLARLQIASRQASTGFLYAVDAAAEFERVAREDAQVLFHDVLVPDWCPLAVTDLAEQALTDGLDYVGELRPPDRWRAQVQPSEVDGVIALSGDSAVAQQQYIDDMLGQAFHASLFVKGTAPASAAASAPAPATDVPITTWHVRADRLDRWFDQPDRDHQAVSDAIRAAGLSGLSLGEIAAQTELAPEAVLRIASRLDALACAVLAISGPPAASEAGEFPLASPLARVQAQTEQEALTSLRHANVAVTDLRRRALLPLTDGTRDRAALIDALRATELIDDDVDAAAVVEECLTAFSRSAFLVASDRKGA